MKFDGFFDYWANWRALIKEFGMSPCDAWGVDIIELYKLFDVSLTDKQDLSLAINANRVINGMPEEMIMNRLSYE